VWGGSGCLLVGVFERVYKGVASVGYCVMCAGLCWVVCVCVRVQLRNALCVGVFVYVWCVCLCVCVCVGLYVCPSCVVLFVNALPGCLVAVGNGCRALLRDRVGCFSAGLGLRTLCMYPALHMHACVAHMRVHAFSALSFCVCHVCVSLCTYQRVSH
jgi:hypothetical protein